MSRELEKLKGYLECAGPLRDMSLQEKEDFQEAYGPALARIGDFVIYREEDAREIWHNT